MNAGAAQRHPVGGAWPKGLRNRLRESPIWAAVASLGPLSCSRRKVVDFWRTGRKYQQAGLRGASRAIDPGAYKTRTGAVPDRGRGLGHMAPTYILVGTTRDLASNGSGGSATFISLRAAPPRRRAGHP